ncbi:ABC transporter ATP-binding protein [Candidatus Neptunochlamydia vexilliferae]|uniref:ABC transporter ATP-binding protein YfiL n=1 Tax=Candidatus Neptunichlamydia vexilliferae TaxID=1651774 RepID=A0ABS0B0F5_9BACT|nr:ABC transporter ATP-binding protein [Candidatus Neptunochlamydia vexilliferae]MBF5059869.1 putative ABC transporter ATP-binding protein YfiL [Candidatus Neptunochlamydia vexilliferae]
MLFLQIEKVSKTYFKKRRVVKEALKGVSLDLFQGEVLGLLGVNGAGKTTLVSILATLHPPTGGEVLWKGESIYKSLLPYRAVVGYCPQRPNIEKQLSLGENLVFSGRCYGLSKKEALVRKEELAKRFKLEEYLDANIDEVSGGYKQRFLIVRALMHRPQLVILDEPTVGLDSHIRRELWEVIADLRKEGITVILTTHYLDEAEYLSDRICLIHEGTIRTIDTPENLKKQHKKNNLEEVFLKFVDDPDAEIFNSGGKSE